MTGGESGAPLEGPLLTYWMPYKDGCVPRMAVPRSAILSSWTAAKRVDSWNGLSVTVPEWSSFADGGVEGVSGRIRLLSPKPSG